MLVFHANIVYNISILTKKKDYIMKYELPKDFIQSDEYCVIEPGLTHFKQDEIINHTDLIKYAKEYTLDAFHVIPHLSIQ